jgi:molybdate transport system regulatory protein
MPKLFLRIDFDEGRAIGPGKIKLLELIDALGSISAAGRRMNMSYRRAWLLVDSLNKCFREPLVASQTGGAHGGGASLTSAGVAVVRHYRAIEAAAHAAGASHIDALQSALATSPASGDVAAGASGPGNRRKGRGKSADQRSVVGAS